MNEIIEKLSSYNIFNYLLPGTLFSFLGDTLTKYKFVQDDLLIGVFLYYFVGLVISRIGSVIIEPILKIINVIEFVKYEDYVDASKQDSFIETLSESNNMFRTLISMLSCMLTLLVYEKISKGNMTLELWEPYILISLLIILFTFSYKKQTSYIVKRVKKTVSTDD